ncbi:MAG: putative sulfate exporter family transporter [Syntrophaceae bacterium]|nr:putative sulfate exporter family transporter [Syntrophaceae bacterium]
MEKQNGFLANLWKNEDWMTVWLGFLILIIFIVGLKFAMPQWNWMNDETFSAKISATAAKIDNLQKDVESKGENDLKNNLILLRTAVDSNKRTEIADAAGKVESSAKNVKDKDLKKKTEKLATDVKKMAGATLTNIFSKANLKQAFYLLIGLWIISVIGIAAMGIPTGKYTVGFPVVFLLAALSFFIAGNATISYYGLEVVFWALIFGLLISNTIGVPSWLKTAVRTEYFIKIGLVLLGAEVLFTTMAKVGIYGMIQAVIVILAVFYFCVWVARKIGLDDEFASILGSAVSVCGVSAAIAAGGAIKGDPKKVSHTISLVLICAVPMLILEPIIAKAIGLSPAVTGAWLGGTIDTTGAVVAAGAIAGDEAMSVAVLVKMAQNVLIGVVAFLLAIWFSLKDNKLSGKKPSAKEIWTRFPKFVLGFIVASLVFSFMLTETSAKDITSITSRIRTWLFTLAFLCIGLETKFKDFVAMGSGKPATVFFTAQAFNIIWTLIFAYLIFGGILFAVPKL